MLTLMLLFTLATPPLVTHVECLVFEQHIAAVACTDISNPWCQGTSVPAPVSCVADTTSMLTLRPTPGQVVAGCVRACNLDGCSPCVGGP